MDESEELVRVMVTSEGGGRDVRMVPRAEVPGHFIPGVLAGVGECFVDPGELRPNDAPRHPEFPEPVRAAVRRIAAAFAGVNPKSLEQWEHGFRCERFPWREIALFERAADAHEVFTRHVRTDDRHAGRRRAEVYRAVMTFTVGGPLPAGGRSALRTVTDRRLREISDWMHSRRAWARFRARADEYRELIAPGALLGPSRVTLAALIGEGGRPNLSAPFHPNELLASADVIFGVDIDSGHEFLAFGRDLLERIAGSDQGRAIRVLHVELDQATEELEVFLARVEHVRGRHDYRPGTP